MNRVPVVSSGPGWRGWLIWTVGVIAYMLAVVNRSSLAAVGVDAADRFNADGGLESAGIRRQRLDGRRHWRRLSKHRWWIFG